VYLTVVIDDFQSQSMLQQSSWIAHLYAVSYIFT
jgi:hypothetical protein